jgi:iron complex transport system substrate-binding protein
MRIPFFAIAAITGLLLSVLSFPAAAADGPVTFKDITGQTISLPQPAKRILLAEGRQIIAISLIHPDPVSVLVGWLGDMRRSDPKTYELYRSKFPAIETIPVLGMGNDGSFSVERAIAAKPDVAVLGMGFAPGGHTNEIAKQLEAAGIPVVFTDFFVDPFHNMLPSMRILGHVLGRNAQAAAYIGFYQEHMDRIASRLSQRSGKSPSVLVETHAGMGECCFSPGKKNFGEYIAFAGGDSISANAIPGPNGHLSLEYVIARNPDIYIATGGSHLAATGGLIIGPGYSLEEIRSRLAALTARPGFSSINAVQNGRIHGLFHNIISTPVNIVAIEALAKWINPSLFGDVDPARTIAEINAKFLAVPLQGIYLVDLK